MSPIGNNWYNLHGTRWYPLADDASGTDDAGNQLPTDILTDCNLRVPASAGDFVYLGGVTVTPALVTLVLLAAASPTAATGFVPLASISLPQPINEDQHYPVQPLYPGVGGWVTFGGGIREGYSGRFATPGQSLLLPRCARWYRDLPVPSLAKLATATPLTGLVKLIGSGDVEVVSAMLEIDGTQQRGLVVQLVNSTTSANPLQTYIGPCGGRPESQTCNKTPIQAINTVEPDCDGNINIEFSGLSQGPVHDCGGEVLDNSLGLPDACAKTTIPAAHDPYTDTCAAAEASLSSYAAEHPEPPAVFSSSLSSVEADCLDLPVSTTFTPLSPLTVVMGHCALTTTTAPSEPTPTVGGDLVAAQVLTANSVSTRNAALLVDCGPDAAHRLVIADVQPQPGVQSNGGIIVNYRTVRDDVGSHIEYFYISVDPNRKRLRILRYNGNGFIEEFGTTIAALRPGDWYRLTVTTSPSGGGAAIAVSLFSLSDTSVPEVAVALTTSQYSPAAGYCGVGTDHATANFSYLHVEAT